MLALLRLSTGCEWAHSYRNADRVCALVLSTDESDIHDTGLIRTGDRRCRVRIPGGQFAASLAAMLDNPYNASSSLHRLQQFFRVDSLLYYHHAPG